VPLAFGAIPPPISESPPRQTPPTSAPPLNNHSSHRKITGAGREIKREGDCFLFVIIPNSLLSGAARLLLFAAFMKTDIHPKYVDAEIRCACGNVIKTRSTKPVIIVGICNACHPFYTGQQKFVDTAGRVDKFQQRAAKTQAAQAALAESKKKKK
jgi:large subunit ribosomal protein L31